jgi:hypothetical protein
VPSLLLSGDASPLDLDPAVKQALELIAPGRREQEKRVKRYDHSYEVYRSAPPADQQVSWRSRLRVKYGMQVIDTALVNIVSGKPRFMVHARGPQDEIGAKAMQLVLDYYIGEDHLVEKEPAFVQQALICGVTAAKNHWLYKKGSRPVRTYTPDGEVTRMNVEMQDLVFRDGPTFETWDMNRMFWAPGARDVESSEYVVLQTYIGKDDLLAQRYNPETQIGLYNNVDDLIASGAAPMPNLSAQDKMLGNSALTRYKDKFLIEEIWKNDRLLVIGNKQVILRDQPNPYWHGQKPIVITQTRPDLFEMLGISESELVDDIQQALQTFQNMVVDNAHLTVQRGITYRESSVVDPNALEIKPGFKIPVQDHDDIGFPVVPPLPPEAFQQVAALKSDLQLVSGINPYISGADLDTVDQNTATGVTALQEVASRLLRFKAAQINWKGFQRTAEQWGDMTQQFMDKKIALKMIVEGEEQQGEQWVEVDPQDVAGHFNYALESSEESLSRQQERGEAVALLNAFAPLLASRPDLNIKPLIERVAIAYDFTNPEELFTPPQQQPPASPQAQPFNPQIRGSEIGPGAQLDPRLSNALSFIRQN